MQNGGSATVQSADKQEPLIADFRWFWQGCAALAQPTQASRQILFDISDHPGLTDIKGKPGPTENLPIAIYLEVIEVDLRDPAIFAYVIDNPRPGIEF
jgi:hypothetical protein